MPEQPNAPKASLIEVLPNGQTDQNTRVEVQFNPETLKVSFSNQLVTPSNPAAGERNGGGARQGGRGGGSTGSQAPPVTTQYVGRGTTKLSVQLWFDVTGVLPSGSSNVDDVRRLTKKVAYFIKPKPNPSDPNNRDQLVPPLARFLWGTFQFDGIVESMEESLEFFSPEGKPLRASVSLSLSKQDFQFSIAEASAQPGATPGAGTRPLTPAPAGSTLQGMAEGMGKGSNWQSIAQANGIENPRLLHPGQLIDFNAGQQAGGDGAVGGALGGSFNTSGLS